MRRNVEVLQWVEHQSSEVINGKEEITYSYSKEWKNFILDQNLFTEGQSLQYPHNPSKWPVQSHIWKNDQVELGDYLITEDQIDKIDSYEILKQESVKLDESNKDLLVLTKSQESDHFYTR